MTGIFPITVSTVCGEGGHTEEVVRRALVELQQAELVYYDADLEMVFVPKIPEEELIGLTTDDSRWRALVKMLRLIDLEAPNLVRMFLERFSGRFFLKDLKNENFGRGRRGGVGGASTPL